MSTSSNDPFSDLFGEREVPSPSESFLDALDMRSPFPSEDLEIIAQPCHSRLRSRKDYIKPSVRRDPLTNSGSNYNGPAIRIPQAYLNIADQYYIGVSLATVMHEKSNCRYMHPYELESIDNKDRNDGENNIVWCPIEVEDLNGIKSFSDLRIVKKTEGDLKNFAGLRPFHGYNSNLLNSSVPKLTSGRQLVQEYNLKRTQLAFMIGKKTNINDIFPTILDTGLTVFSDEMVEDTDSTTVEDNTSTEPTTILNSPPPPECCVRKYAPRLGPAEGNEDVLIFCTRKLQERNYGKVQITFESDTPNIPWSIEIDPKKIEVIDQMISFKTPAFPSAVEELTPVKIILKQKERVLDTIRYFYVRKSLVQCATCQANAIRNSTPAARNNPNKRTKHSTWLTDEETDAVVPISENKPELRQSKSETGSHSSSISSNTNQTSNDNYDQICKIIEQSAESLFTTNDFTQILRICRPFIRNRPELLHAAISNNHSDLITKFIPVAQIDLLREKNQLGETTLLHAARLNHIDIVKALLERQNSDKLLEDINNQGQNIFHILALNNNSDAILDLMINHLLKNWIGIQDKFDHIDAENQTPLQLAISKNNLPATRYLLKYFKHNVCKTNDHTGDNLIHLAVRYGDLLMIKYLLNEGQLIAQGKQSNLTMTPMELAESMKRDEMVKYFNEIYPPPAADDDESSEND